MDLCKSFSVVEWLSKADPKPDPASAAAPGRADPKSAVERLVADLNQDARLREEEALERVKQRLFDLD
jgi:hypothetical protein